MSLMKRSTHPAWTKRWIWRYKPVLLESGFTVSWLPVHAILLRAHRMNVKMLFSYKHYLVNVTNVMYLFNCLHLEKLTRMLVWALFAELESSILPGKDRGRNILDKYNKSRTRQLYLEEESYLCVCFSPHALTHEVEMRWKIQKTYG